MTCHSPVLVETIRGNLHAGTGDQKLDTYYDKAVPIEDGGADIGSTLLDMVTEPDAINHVVIRVYGGMPDDPGLSGFRPQLVVSWHTYPGDDSAVWEEGFAVGWWSALRTLAPTGVPWTKAILNGMDVSFEGHWESQTPFSGNVTWRMAELEVQVWGRPQCS